MHAVAFVHLYSVLHVEKCSKQASTFITVYYSRNSCPISLTVVYCSPGTGGGGGDLEPSSIGRFCW